MENKKKNILTIAIIVILAIAVIILLTMVVNSNKATTLTMDNYKDYFYTNWTTFGSSPNQLAIEVRAISSNFNYEDVEVSIRINGTYKNANNETIELNNEIKTVKCKINGNGNETIGDVPSYFNRQDNLSFEVIKVKGRIKGV